MIIINTAGTTSAGSDSTAAGWTGWAMSSFTKLYGTKATEDKKPVGPAGQTSQTGSFIQQCYI